MISHRSIWNAIDVLAYRYDLTCSGLAKKAGLDATTFNPSKRITPSGRERWPSSESIAKILNATGVTLTEFASLAEPISNPDGLHYPEKSDVPLRGFAQTSNPLEAPSIAANELDVNGVKTVAAPAPFPESDFAVRINGDALRPFYQEGDVLIVSPEAQIEPGDKVAIGTKTGGVIIRLMSRALDDGYDTLSLSVDEPRLKIKNTDIQWIAKITWASQ